MFIKILEKVFNVSSLENALKNYQKKIKIQFWKM